MDNALIEKDIEAIKSAGGSDKDILNYLKEQGISYSENTVLTNKKSNIGRLLGMAGKGIIESIPGRTIGKLIPGYQNAADYYKGLGEPQKLGEKLAYGVGSTLENLPVYGGAIGGIRAATGLGPVISGSLGFGGVSGAEKLIEGQPEQAIPAALQGAASYPIMHVAGLAGRLAPQGNTLLSRLLTGAGFAGASATLAPEGEKLSQGILGGGLGALMPQTKLTPKELEQAAMRTQGYIEGNVRSLINSLTEGPNRQLKKFISWSAGINNKIWEHLSDIKQQGKTLEGIDNEINKNPETARILTNDVLNYLQNTKRKIGGKVGNFINKIIDSPLSMKEEATKIGENLVAQGLITPAEQEITDIGFGKGKGEVKLSQLLKGRTKGEQRAYLLKHMEGQLTPEDFKTYKERLFPTDEGSKMIQMAEEASLPIQQYLVKTYKKLSNIENVKQGKLVMESIANKVDNLIGKDMDTYSSQLWNLYHQIGDKIGVVGDRKIKGFSAKYKEAKKNYSDFINESTAIKDKLNTKPTSPRNWMFETDTENIVKELEDLTWGSGKLVARIHKNKSLSANLKDFLTVQELQSGNPSMWRSRIQRMLIGALMGGTAGPAGALGGMALTMPATWRKLLIAEQKLSAIKEQLTTLRPSANQNQMQ